ncbi:MAG: imidazolonepropionase [Acidobacteria bacterium]|nr:imidazolonepropionase [Acidobacteriota bacterium]
MQNADLIIHNAGQLVTCASGGKPKRGDAMRDVGIIENGAVAVKDGVIVGIGKTSDILSEFAGNEADVIDAEGKAVIPGFVDPHTHIVFAGDRLNEFELKIKGADYLEILAAGGGIISTVKNTREASFEQLVEESRKRLDKMLACGTTTCEIKTGYGLDTETELKMLRVIEELDKTHPVSIVPTFLAAHAVPPEFKGNTDGYVDLICDEMLPMAWEWYESSHFFRPSDPLQAGHMRSGQIPFYADVFCEKNAFDLTQAERFLTTAKEIGFKLKSHVDQFTNLGGSRLGIELNAASIDHLDAISDEEIEMLAQSETVGIVIPTENFNAGKTQFANARKLIDASCALALSTDYNPGSAPCPSMPMAMAISCRYQKLLPAEALNAATINAAFSIGLGETHGSIEIGKNADLTILDFEDYREMIYEFGKPPAGDLFIGGVGI